MTNHHGYEMVTVNFLGNITAQVGVRLMDGDGEDPADIYGHISGRYGIENEFVVFDLKQHDYVCVSPGDFIPLSRPVVNVPSKATSLEITAYLMDYDFITSDDEIANGTATFHVRSYGQSHTVPIVGKYGYVEVTVFWGSSLA